MREQETSGTAIFATMVRAAHQTMDDDPKILADPVSHALATHLQGSSAWEGFRKLSPALFAACRSALAVRGRYAEDVFKEVSADLTCQTFQHSHRFGIPLTEAEGSDKTFDSLADRGKTPERMHRGDAAPSSARPSKNLAA